MKSLIVRNYKNIRELNIDSLARVNLIVGRNNVGKSTLLEAISIYASDGNISWLKTLLKSRGEKTFFRSAEENQEEKELESFSSLFSDRNIGFTEKDRIVIGTKDQEDTVSLRLVKFIEKEVQDGIGLERTIRTIIKDEDIDKQSDINSSQDVSIGLEILGIKREFLYPFTGRRFGWPLESRLHFEYVKTNDFQISINASLWDNISLLKEEVYVIEALRIIEPRIEKLNFLNDGAGNTMRINDEIRAPFVLLKDSDKRYRLSSMGDGINRILTIILALVNCKDGLFLLDEFETGLHYSVQADLWQIIFKLSEALNIQVFVTTHSSDCIDSFAEINTEGKGKLIRLENREDKIVEVSYDNEGDLKFAVDQDIEIR